MKKQKYILKNVLTWVFISVLLAGLTAKLSAETETMEPVCAVKNTLAYTSTNFGFSIRFPKSWKGNYQVCESLPAEGSHVGHYEFSVRKNKKSDFKDIFVLHIYDSETLEDGGLRGEIVSSRDLFTATWEPRASDKSIVKFTKDLPKIKKSFRWINVEQFRKIIESL